MNEPDYEYLKGYIDGQVVDWFCTNHNVTLATGFPFSYHFEAVGLTFHPVNGVEMQEVFKKFEEHWKKEHAR